MADTCVLTSLKCFTVTKILFAFMMIRCQPKDPFTHAHTHTLTAALLDYTGANL